MNADGQWSGWAVNVRDQYGQRLTDEPELYPTRSGAILAAMLAGAAELMQQDDGFRPCFAGAVTVGRAEPLRQRQSEQAGRADLEKLTTIDVPFVLKDVPVP